MSGHQSSDLRSPFFSNRSGPPIVNRYAWPRDEQTLARWGCLSLPKHETDTCEEGAASSTRTPIRRDRHPNSLDYALGSARAVRPMRHPCLTTRWSQETPDGCGHAPLLETRPPVKDLLQNDACHVDGNRLIAKSVFVIVSATDDQTTPDKAARSHIDNARFPECGTFGDG